MTEPKAMGEGQIIKRDARGRLRLSREHREALLAEFDQGAMSGQQFAQWAGIKYPTFAHWLQRRRKAKRQPKEIKPGGMHWVEAVVEKNNPPAEEKATPCPEALLLYAPGGIKIEVHDEAQARLAVMILNQLQRPC